MSTRKRLGAKQKVPALKEVQETFHLKAEGIKLQLEKQRNEITGDDKARSHHDRRLLRLAFANWRNMCAIEISERKEWSLLVRANYHYKYHLCLKTWRAWQVYVVRKKVKRAKESVALMQANYVHLRRAFKGWKAYCIQRRSKLATNTELIALLKRKTLQKYFAKWLENLQMRRERKRKDATALHHWKETLNRRIFQEWKNFVILQREKKKKISQAQRFCKISLLSKCMYQGFLPYVLHRRDRLEAKASASQFYMDRLQSRAFQHWQTRLAVHQHILQKQEEIKERGRRSKLRRFMEHWKHYVTLCYNDRQNMRMAVLHHQQCLLRMGFLSLQLTVVVRRRKVLENDQAVAFHKKQMLSQAWAQWMRRIEEREEDEIIEDTRKGREHYRLLSLKKGMMTWKQYLKWRQLRKSNYRTAEAHHQRVLSYRALSALADNVQIRDMKRQDKEQSLQFYRYHTMNITFMQWKASYHLSLEHRSMERMAILHYQKKSMRRIFHLWKYATEDVLTGQDNMIIAQTFFKHRLCHRHFHRWKEFVKHSKECYYKDQMAQVHYQTCILHKVWTAWRIDALRRRRKRTSMEKADNYYNQKLLCQAMADWKVYHEVKKGKFALSETKYNSIMKERMRAAFKTWRSNVLEVKKKRQQDEVACNHRHVLVVRRTFTAWHEYVLNHALKEEKQKHQITEAVKQLNQGKLRRCFCHWRQKSKNFASYRIANSTAVEHHDHKVMVNVIKKWKEFKQIQTRKLILQQQSAWLNRTRLEAKFLLQWKKQHVLSLRERAETNVALWHWSLVLQEKVLTAWRSYTMTRRVKKQRLEAAMILRHQRLLRTGLRKLILTSDEVSQRRLNSLSNQQIKTASKSFQVVRRCALHWRQKTVMKQMQEGSIMKPKPDPWIDESFLTASSTFRPRPKRPNFLRTSLMDAGLWESLEDSSVHDKRGALTDGQHMSTKHLSESNVGAVEQTSPDNTGRSHDHITNPDQDDDDLISPTMTTERDEEENEREDYTEAPVPLINPAKRLETRKLLPPSAFTNKPFETPQQAIWMLPNQIKWTSKTKEKQREEPEPTLEDGNYVCDVKENEMHPKHQPRLPLTEYDDDEDSSDHGNKGDDDEDKSINDDDDDGKGYHGTRGDDDEEDKDSHGSKGDDDDDGSSTCDETVTTEDKLLELRNLLLEYQRLKDQINLLEDQKKTLAFLLKDSEDESKEEYDLVQEDITHLTASLVSTKTRISYLMVELGLQNSS